MASLRSTTGSHPASRRDETGGMGVGGGCDSGTETDGDSETDGESDTDVGTDLFGRERPEKGPGNPVYFSLLLP
ncbi:MAG: hypothetical protein BWZ08_00141 [candidate division BRC1 bacterium ADurb.BinA292]|nr:MAG: hypothetical protein BWZ08_00141 [candidate division BRC1 bacterium ADurb.BinA292]